MHVPVHARVCVFVLKHGEILYLPSTATMKSSAPVPSTPYSERCFSSFCEEEEVEEWLLLVAHWALEYLSRAFWECTRLEPSPLDLYASHPHKLCTATARKNKPLGELGEMSHSFFLPEKLQAGRRGEWGLLHVQTCTHMP